MWVGCHIIRIIVLAIVTSINNAIMVMRMRLIGWCGSALNQGAIAENPAGLASTWTSRINTLTL